MDVMALLKERRAKAESKVLRAEKALESAKKELADVLAAERVVGDITGVAPEPKPTENSVSARDISMISIVPTHQSDAKSPADLHPLYIEAGTEDLNLEAFRTALWRMLKKTVPSENKIWTVKSESGRYWREVLTETGLADDLL
ncbi:hypothetical protein [Rhizorhabdus sp. FW153]|uniref:hypothetical protein n=1 Tax=Rhizorhabdus sp. FW153 TaxID=3400216 RepID=UPI003CECA383